MQRPISIIGVAAFLAFSGLGLAACEDNGSLEEAGESADEAVEDAQDKVKDATN